MDNCRIVELCLTHTVHQVDDILYDYSLFVQRLFAYTFLW